MRVKSKREQLSLLSKHIRLLEIQKKSILVYYLQNTGGIQVFFRDTSKESGEVMLLTQGLLMVKGGASCQRKRPGSLLVS
jgi:hypothetical protein